MIKTVNKTDVKRFFEEKQQISIGLNGKIIFDEVNLSIDSMDEGLIPISTYYRVSKGIHNWLFKSYDKAGIFYTELLTQKTLKAFNLIK